MHVHRTSHRNGVKKTTFGQKLSIETGKRRQKPIETAFSSNTLNSSPRIPSNSTISQL